MKEPTEIEQPYRLMKRGVAIIFLFTIFGTTAMIYFGQPRDLWASFETINGPPSLEIVP